MIDIQSRDIDWAMHGSATNLRPSWEATFTTFVYERDGNVQGLANYHSFRSGP